MSKKINTLIEDVNSLLDKGMDVPDELCDETGKVIAQLLKDRLSSYQKPRESYLRMSNLGKHPRQIWYDINGTHTPEQLDAETKMKFLYGDLIEQLAIFLAKASGHSVTNEQESVTLDGVTGSIDCLIDGELVDVKSASSFGYQKFNSFENLQKDDPFGYIKQIRGYTAATGKSHGYFWAIEKEKGKHQLLKVPGGEDEVRNAVNSQRNVLDQSEPPPRCAEPVAEGKSGNERLGVTCSYCPHKHECWKDSNGGRGLRGFLYSNGLKWFTTIKKLPQVFEIDKDKYNNER